MLEDATTSSPCRSGRALLDVYAPAVRSDDAGIECHSLRRDVVVSYGDARVRNLWKAEVLERRLLGSVASPARRELDAQVARGQ